MGQAKTAAGGRPRCLRCGKAGEVKVWERRSVPYTRTFEYWVCLGHGKEMLK